MEEEDSLIIRVGTFFMVMGLGSFVLFVISDIADQVILTIYLSPYCCSPLAGFFAARKPLHHLQGVLNT